MIVNRKENLLIFPLFDSGDYLGKFIVEHKDIPRQNKEDTKKFFDVLTKNITIALYKTLEEVKND